LTSILLFSEFGALSPPFCPGKLPTLWLYASFKEPGRLSEREREWGQTGFGMEMEGRGGGECRWNVWDFWQGRGAFIVHRFMKIRGNFNKLTPKMTKILPHIMEIL